MPVNGYANSTFSIYTAALQRLASRCRASSQRGVALILVLLVVSLASILVVQIAYSTYLQSRMNSAVERSLQAEYLLKSALNLARVLIKFDKTPEDSKEDLWFAFKNGSAIPSEWVGVNIPNVNVELEIRPEESKMPLRALVRGSGDPDERWVRIFIQLFINLGFENDNEKDHTGYFGEKVFSPTEMVANLVDYMDRDNESVNQPETNLAGIESELPKGTFRNEAIMRVSELQTIPGFTPGRVMKLLPLVTARQSGRVNINFAPAVVLRSLNSGLSEKNVADMIAFRESVSGPFKLGELRRQLTDEVGISETVATEIQTILQDSSSGSLFQVLAKVDYGTSTYFLRSMVWKSGSLSSGLPRVESFELL